MQPSFSRRDFFKVAGLGFGALAFNPFDLSLINNLAPYYTPKRLPQFPNAEIIGRLVDATDIRSRPTNDPAQNTAIRTLGADTLIPWTREVIGSVVALTNQKYLETPEGYIWSSRIQPTRNLPNTPITEIPAGQSGFWAEVTVPYVDLTLDGAPVSPWIQSLIQYQFPPRAYYSQVLWIDQIRQTNGFVEYRWNESPNGHGYGFGDVFWADGAGLKVLTEADVAPISPEIDPAEKKIVVDLTYQTLSAFEAGREVFFCRISSGAVFDPLTGAISDERATPVGDLLTHWKIISLNMSGGGSAAGYSTPAVPWDTVISGEGIAIHGAFWHNDFGEKRSHGCINVKPEDAKWLFRWTTPYISLAQSEMRMSLPDHGTLVTTTELKV
ncbi:MAG: L,D-transpeptidase [Anaerolineales bacterium]|nr:L,D-transpeptidase [Anaerolineales bacterium]